MTEHDYDNGYRAGMHDMRVIAQARIEGLTKVLERLEHWFDTDDEILEDMGVGELEDHKRQHRYILATLKGTNK